MPATPKSGFRVKTSAIITTLVLLFAAAGVLVFSADLRALGAVIGTFDLRYLPPIIALSLVKFVMWYVKWDYYLDRIGVRIPRFDDACIYYSGFALSLTPGKVGELLRSWLLQERYAVAAERTVPLTLMERVTDACAMAIIACLTFSSVGSSALPALVVLAFLFLALYLLRRESLVARIFVWSGSVRWLRRTTVVLEDAYASTYSISSARNNTYGIANGLVSWVAEGFVLYLILIALGSPIGLAQAMFIASAAAIVGALSSIPGGLIANELSAIALLRLVGVPTDVATAATLLSRISTLWLGIAIGIVAYVLLRTLRPAVDTGLHVQRFPGGES